MSAFKDFCHLAKALLKTLPSFILTAFCLAVLGLLFPFLTPSFADTTPPAITDSNPRDGATNAPIEINNFWIQFSEPMDQQSVLDSPIRLEDLTTGQMLPGDWAGGALDSLQDFVNIGLLSATFNETGDRLNLFSATFLLFPEHTYRVTFAQPIQAKDLAGNTLSTAKTTFTFTTVAVGQTEVSGTISSDRTWGIAGNPYTLTGNLTVESGVTLTILPGVEVRFGGYYELVVNGQLIAEGTKQDAIFFTSAKSTPNPGDWDRIVFRFGAASGRFKNCIFKYGSIIETVGASLSITESRIQNFSGAGLALQSDSAVTLSVTHNDISYNQVGVSLSGSHPSAVVRYNDITHNDTGVYVNGSFQTLEFNNISSNTNYELYNNTSATVQAKNNYWGTTDANLIANKIYDVSDNPSKGKVNYSPLLPSSGITSIQGSKNANILINNGDAAATSHNVTLTLSADSPTPTEMIVSESPTFAGASYETYTTSKSFTLSNGVGVKYVYAKFKDGSGNVSAVAFDSITKMPTEVSGIITEDMTWRLADSPYIIKGNTLVESGVTLTIEPGTLVKFDGYYELAIRGKLIAEGTADAKITFTSNKDTPASGDWYRLYCGSSSSFNTITSNNQGIVLSSSSVQVKFNDIHNNQEYDAVNTYRFGINTPNNWWGTTDASVIATHIYDYYDDYNYGKINYSPILASSSTSLPIGPTNPSVSIIDYLGTVTTPILQLQLSADSPDQMLISDDHTFPPQFEWEPYAATKDFQSYGTKYIYAKFKDASGNESAIAFAQPKQMVYIQKSALLGNKPVLLQVKVPSGFGVAQVRGFYRAIGGGSYTEQLMTSQGGIYCLWIPDSVTGNGIEYYIQAEDGSGNVLTTLPETNPSTNPYSLSAAAILQQSVQASKNNAFEFAVGVTIEIPADALSSDTNLQVSSLSTPPTPPSGITATDIGYNLAMADGTTVFLQPVSITFNYADSDVQGIDESTLRVYYWDGSAWRFAGGTVDVDANRISVQTTHFTDFAVFGGAISERTMTLKRGLNLIAIPYSSGTYTSHSLIQSISGCKVVTPWDATGQRWGDSAFDAGGGVILPPDPFNIKSNDGYFVQVNADTTTTFGGVALTSPVTLNLKRGLNLISIPYSSGYTSHSLIQSITGCKVVTPWDATGQRWGDSAFDAGGGVILPDEPFNIEVGRGYFVQVDADTSWMPSAPSPAPALHARTSTPVAQISNLATSDKPKIESWVTTAASNSVAQLSKLAFSEVTETEFFAAGRTKIESWATQSLIKKKRRGTAKKEPWDTVATAEKAKIESWATMASGVKITDIRVSNISSSSVTISWVTDSITDGRVRYGTTPEVGSEGRGQRAAPTGQGQRAAPTDDGGMDDVHWVQITGLSPETIYYYEVVSGGSVDDNDGKLYTFTTSKVGQGIPYLIYGQVLKEISQDRILGFNQDRILGYGAGTVVYVTVKRGEVTSGMLSAVVDKNGFWQVNLGNLKNPETNDVLSYSAGDVIHIFAQGGADGIAEMETTVSGNSPQSIKPDLVLQSSEISKFSIQLEAGLNMISLPLKPPTSYTARSFADAIGATVVIKLDEKEKKFIGFTPDEPTDGFPIEGGKGYIVNVEEGKVVTFTGTAWTNEPADKAAPSGQAKETWAFVVSGMIEKDEYKFPFDGLTVQVRNLRTGAVILDVVSQSGYFSLASADLSHKSVIQVSDKLEISFTTGQVGYGKIICEVKIDDIRKAFLSVRLPLSSLMPSKNALLQNYPNPFNAETWIPYQLARESGVEIKIFNVAGQLVKTLELGHREAGYYLRKEQTAHWDGRNNLGESVASGVYFYTINAGNFTATRRLVILK